LKILLATYWLLPHLGGVWSFMEQIRKRLELQGHQVDLLGHSPDYQKFHIVNTGQEIHKSLIRPFVESRLSHIAVPHSMIDPIVWQYEIDRYCLELAAAYFGLEKYDVIHTQDVLSACALNRVKPKRTPHVAHLHGSVAAELMMHFRTHPELGVGENSLAWYYFRAIEHYGAALPDITVTANHWMKNILTGQFGIAPDKITVFPYGLDTDSFWARHDACAPLQKPMGKKIIICPARLTFVKGIDLLITALNRLKAIRQDWICWIVGDGELRADLEQQAIRLGLQSDIVFWGRRDDIPALLGLSDIFVHSCIQDNQPFSVMEAQIAGKAVVVSDAGGLPEMVEHGKTGLVFPSRNTDVLCSHLYHLLEHDEFRLRLGHEAQRWAAVHWSIDTMFERLLHVYGSAQAIVNR
jgi:glycosyltransferase involved in cell wall biosynthesis